MTLQQLLEEVKSILLTETDASNFAARRALKLLLNENELIVLNQKSVAEIEQMDTLALHDLTVNVIREWSRRWTADGADPLQRDSVIRLIRNEVDEVERQQYKCKIFRNIGGDLVDPEDVPTGKSGRKKKDRKKREPRVVVPKFVLPEE